jgi:hypothetical protein
MHKYPRFKNAPVKYSIMLKMIPKIRKWFDTDDSRGAAITSPSSEEYWKRV